MCFVLSVNCEWSGNLEECGVTEYRELEPEMRKWRKYREGWTKIEMVSRCYYRYCEKHLVNSVCNAPDQKVNIISDDS